jgi:serine/threonine protein kinase
LHPTTKGTHPYFATLDPLAVDLLDKIFVYDPDVRLTAQQALAHPYFEEFHDERDEPLALRPFDGSFEEIDTDVAGWALECKKEVEVFRSKYSGTPTSPRFDPMNGVRAAEKHRAFRAAQKERAAVSVKFVYQDDPDHEFARRADLDTIFHFTLLLNPTVAGLKPCYARALIACLSGVYFSDMHHH